MKLDLRITGDGLWVYLVFGLLDNGNVDLIAIATSNPIALKYKENTLGKKRGTFEYIRTWIEERLTDHLLAESMYPKTPKPPGPTTPNMAEPCGGF